MRNKTCKVCKQKLPIREFYKHPTSKDGHRNQCRKCISEQKKRYYYQCKANPVVWAAIQAQAREYYLNKKQRRA